MHELCCVGPFTIRGAEIVGAKVGGELFVNRQFGLPSWLSAACCYILPSDSSGFGAAAVPPMFSRCSHYARFFSLLHFFRCVYRGAFDFSRLFEMNDKIVIFDRIRENRALAAQRRLRGAVNKSINQYSSRTISPAD